MAATTIYPKSVAHNGLTWAGGVGGLVEVEIRKGGRDLQDRTGDDEFATMVAVVDKFAEAIVTVREPANASIAGS